MTDDLVMVDVTPAFRVTRARYREWIQGVRPLPGQDATDFFAELVRAGLLPPGRAGQLHERHLALTNLEAAAPTGQRAASLPTSTIFV